MPALCFWSIPCQHVYMGMPTLYFWSIPCQHVYMRYASFVYLVHTLSTRHYTGMRTLCIFFIPCQHVYMWVCQLCVPGLYPVNTSICGYASFVYLVYTLSTRLYVGMPALCTWSIPCQHVYMGVCQLCVSGPYPVNTSIWGYASFAYLVHTLSTRLYGGMSALRIWSIPCQHVYMGVCQLCVSGPYPVNTSIWGMPALRIWSIPCQHVYMWVCQLCVPGLYPVNTSICGYASFAYLVRIQSTTLQVLVHVRLYTGMPALRIWSIYILSTTSTSVCGYASFVYLVHTLSARL